MEGIIMTNNEMLQNIEYLREKANITYEEASELLNDNGGDVMRVMIELEKQGRLNEQADRPGMDKLEQCCQQTRSEVKEKATSFFHALFYPK